MLLEKWEVDKIVALVWDGQRYSQRVELSLEEAISVGKLRITHYYGLAEIIYSSIVDFTFHRITGWEYVKVHIWWSAHRIGQFAFNYKKLVTKRRIELLAFLIEDQLSREHNGVNSMDLMTRLYSIKWVLHPNSTHQLEKLELYLNSLAESGDLRKVNDKYVVTGKAINTLERYEEEERRHRESAKIQRRIVWLTLLIALFALLQTGLVKMPTLIDLSGGIAAEGRKSTSG